MDLSLENGRGSAPTADVVGDAGSLSWTIAIQEVLAILGRKWVVPVVRELMSGPKRHFQLSQSIKGVTPKVLTETLRFLERDGVAERVLHDDGRGSKSIAYQLTPLGRTLATPVDALYQWGREHLEDVQHARQESDKVG